MEAAMEQQARPITLSAPVNHCDHIRGSASAKVTLIEYGDFECPACGQAYHAVKILLKHFADDVRFVFRHFPRREEHAHAESAAEAAETAAAQRGFWPMHDLLFENQLHLKEKNLRQYAEKLEFDLARYDQEMHDHIYLQRVQESIQGGGRSGISSIPAFFVNGVLHDVSFGLEHLESAIEAELRNRPNNKVKT
jgi:protein-disulfide isomerase